MTSDPSTMSSSELNRRLVELQGEYHAASHVVAERDLEGIPPETLAWWRAAFAEVMRRRWEVDVSVLPRADVEPMERRKERSRKPSH
jgi:hypothetical protein